MKKILVINKDIYKYIYAIANKLIRTKNDDIKYLISRVIEYYTKYYDKPIEGIIRKIESLPSSEDIVKGVCFYFIGKIYSKRQDFSLAIVYYEMAEAFLRKSNKKLSSYINKEIFLSKMAFHYQDN